MIDSVRARLTIWYVGVLAAVLVAMSALTYVLLARSLYARVDHTLRTVLDIATTSLSNDLSEGQDAGSAARSTTVELSSPDQLLAIYDGGGRLLAEQGRDEELALTLPAIDTIPSSGERFETAVERDGDDRHRLALRRVSVGPAGTNYVILAGHALDASDEELSSFRRILGYVVPIALCLAAAGGWLLAWKSLAPVVAMADRARRIGTENVGEQLPVANPRDELGRLAGTFNELLQRLGASLAQQRQFMADASHELRTPVATARAAASIALQKPHRPEQDYRHAIQTIEQQTVRLSRIVEDMFTLARADAGNYPVHRAPMYLDEVIEEVVRAARILAATRSVTIEQRLVQGAEFCGDEELVKRLMGNLLGNAARYAPDGTAVVVELVQENGRYTITVNDAGPGIPPEMQAHIFERFYRGDAARSRPGADGGAGLGLALARWIARIHGGDVRLVRSSPAGSTFVAELPVA
jgi:two-component system, OmpR family, sensor kinase